MPSWNHLVRGLAEIKAVLVCAMETRSRGRVCCKMDRLYHTAEQMRKGRRSHLLGPRASSTQKRQIVLNGCKAHESTLNLEEKVHWVVTFSLGRFRVREPAHLVHQ